MIDINNLTLTLDNKKILKNINLKIKEGRIYGLIGPNGVGKTSLIKCLTGIYEVTEGEIFINGVRVGIGEKMPHNIAFTIEQPAFLNEYSGRKNLEFLYELRHKKDSLYIRSMIEKVGLDYESKKKVSKYSLGMKQRLAIAQVLMEEAPILIMDEPMNGLDRKGVQDVRELIIEEKKKGKIILLASHNREDIEYLCDEVYRLDNGKVV